MGRARALFLTLVLLAVGTLAGVISFFHTVGSRSLSESRREGREVRTSRTRAGAARPSEGAPQDERLAIPAQPPPPPPPPRQLINSTGDDSELFTRALAADAYASAASASPSTPSAGSPPGKLAFLFMTRGALPLAPLWATFFAGHEGLFSIYVHASQKEPEKLPPVFQGRVVPSKIVTWGDINVVDAERRLVANALLDPQNSHFILVSESCIPLYNLTFIRSYLTSTNLSYVGVIQDPRRSNRDRWNHHFHPIVSRDRWHKGSQWFAITRKVAKVIIADKRYYPLFRDYCLPKNFCYADEHYFPTMLSALVPELIANRSLTWTDWSAGGWHPAAFGPEKISQGLINRARGKPECRAWGKPAYCSIFARKFKESALGRLLFLSAYLGF